ncbi:DUF4188 domain-containing protein [Paenibacillus camelliae]|uniref:DUF4188 domain-containing protein n=1 Tax=Paenibacillus camelliae TaxID=512410 RepID=UPI00203F4974|nr:DUF4188 domain-containing protein [Paenibacillus camelliae]MCM3633326.1 DUF4188 domain-containing protein [Paenibacillus camelliae]
MSASILKGRYTVNNDQDIVVFLIGMRINKWWALHKWLPVFLAMPGMVQELYTHKAKLGFMSMESYFGLRTTIMVQYWNSTEELLAYSKANKHMEAWKKFNQRVGSSSQAVAVYHETYQLKAGSYESIYVNMPPYGLGKALSAVPVTKESQTASKRLNKG